MRLAQICAQRGYKIPNDYYCDQPEITASNTIYRNFRELLISLIVVANINHIGNCCDNALLKDFLVTLKRSATMSTQHEKKNSRLYFITTKCFIIQSRHTHNRRVSLMNYEKPYFANQKVSEKIRPYHSSGKIVMEQLGQILARQEQ